MTDKSLTATVRDADEMQPLDIRTNECIEKINEHANRAASRVIELMGKVKKREDQFDSMRNAMRGDFEKIVSDAMTTANECKETAQAIEKLTYRLASVEVQLGIVEATADHTLSLIGKRVALKSDMRSVMTAGAVDDNGRVLCYWFSPAGLSEKSIPALALEVVNFD